MGKDRHEDGSATAGAEPAQRATGTVPGGVRAGPLAPGQWWSLMRKHWSRLTLFLRVPGAPLDDNICERALKMSICHRKTSLFYKTLNGAHVGDAFMALIHTAELNGVDPFDDLVTLQRHHERLADNPGDWMPWTYKDTLARLAKDPVPPP